MGVIAIEKQVLKFMECEDRWIQRDIDEHQQLEFQRLRKQKEMDEDSSEWKAFHMFMQSSFDKFEAFLLHKDTHPRQWNISWEQD